MRGSEIGLVLSRDECEEINRIFMPAEFVKIVHSDTRYLPLLRLLGEIRAIAREHDDND